MLARHMLAHPLLPIVTGLVDGEPVPVTHTGEARYSIDATGQHWVRKREPSFGFQQVLAEAITWVLGRRLGVPIPDGAVCIDRGEMSWLSRRVECVVEWNPVQTSFVINLD